MVTMPKNQQLLDMITSLSLRASDTVVPCVTFLDDTAGMLAASKLISQCANWAE